MTDQHIAEQIVRELQRQLAAERLRADQLEQKNKKLHVRNEELSHLARQKVVFVNKEKAS